MTAKKKLNSATATPRPLVHGQSATTSGSTTATGKRKPTGKRTGRPRKETNDQIFDAFAEAGGTLEEIAAVMRLSADTVERYCVRRFGKTFAEVSAEKKGVFRASLRRCQMQAALAGDRTMMIWRGKQDLGQTDRKAIETSGPGGGPIEHSHTHSLKDDDYRAEIRSRLVRRKPD